MFLERLFVFLLAFVGFLIRAYQANLEYIPILSDETNLPAGALMILKSGSLGNGFLAYGDLVKLLYIPVVFIHTLFSIGAGWFSTLSSFDDYDVLIYLCRLVNCAAGGVAIVLIYYLGKKIHSQLFGFLAALFLLLNPAYFLLSIYSKPGPFPILFALATIWFCVDLIREESPRLKSAVLAGFFTALALSTKLTMSSLVVFSTLCVLFRKNSEGDSFLRHLTSPLTLFFFVTLAFTFLVTSPAILTNLEGFFVQSAVGMAAQSKFDQDVLTWGMKFQYVWDQLGEVFSNNLTLGCALLGALFFFFQKREGRFFLISNLISFLSFSRFIGHTEALVPNATHFELLIPFLILYVSYFLTWFLEKVESRVWRSLLIIFLLGFLNYWPVTHLLFNSKSALLVSHPKESFTGFLFHGERNRVPVVGEMYLPDDLVLNKEITLLKDGSERAFFIPKKELESPFYLRFFPVLLSEVGKSLLSLEVILVKEYPKRKALLGKKNFHLFRQGAFSLKESPSLRYLQEGANQLHEVKIDLAQELKGIAYERADSVLVILKVKSDLNSLSVKLE